MKIEDTELYASYLHLYCRDIIDDATGFVLNSVQINTEATAKPKIKREIAILMRYWLSHDIWNALDDDQALARELNLVVLRQFTDGFKIPKDGTGLKYAELPTLQEQVKELIQRLRKVLDWEDRETLASVERKVMDWRRACREAVNTVQTGSSEAIRRQVSIWMDAHKDMSEGS